MEIGKKQIQKNTILGVKKYRFLQEG